LFAQCLSSLGSNLFRQKRYDLSERYYREALAVARQLHKKAHPELLSALLDLATALGRQGKYTKESGALLSEAERLLSDLPASVGAQFRPDWVRLSCELYLQRDRDHQKAASLLERQRRAARQPQECEALARLYATCLEVLASDANLASEQREKLQEEYGAAAVDLLKRSWKSGGRRRPSWVAASELPALRQRADFQTLVAEIETATGEKK
jgi:hypothetical protein